ncbi:MAG: 6-phosphogluconolactonase [Alphaproteobacteria bacterium]|nr:MAG: 6-phosphogluconolactonase [Alphaproteobacteria bacterium]
MSEVIWAVPADDAAVVEKLAEVLATPGATIAVPGGSTPAPILRALAKRSIDWPQVTITLSDDREVPHDHVASNFGALVRALVGTGATLIPLEAGAVPPRLDLCWVGMGADGHVASIFPNVDLPVDNPPAVVKTLPDPLPPEAPFPRVTLNYAALANGGELILVVRGEEKRAILQRAIAGDSDLPIARLLAAAKGPVTIYWSPQ